MAANFVNDQNDFFPYGGALETFGLANICAVNPYGLLTRGFLWQGKSIYGPYSGVSLSTSWVNNYAGASLITTGWTLSLGSVFGSYPG